MTPSQLGIVVIGRNEGQRLQRSLTSALASTKRVIYVDSGSSDDSVAVAERLGVSAWRLDPARPFSAARARNEGFAQLRGAHPELQIVQFLDGDCELAPHWLVAGLAELERGSDTALVCGHIRERDPAASPYNRMCALEWRQRPGEVDACGGNFMVRADLFDRLGGFRCEVTAGEEDELLGRPRRGLVALFSMVAARASLRSCVRAGAISASAAPGPSLPARIAQHAPLGCPFAHAGHSARRSHGRSEPAPPRRLHASVLADPPTLSPAWLVERRGSSVRRVHRARQVSRRARCHEVQPRSLAGAPPCAHRAQTDPCKQPLYLDNMNETILAFQPTRNQGDHT
jgi:hypothetical protein